MRAYCNVSCEQVNWKVFKRKCNSSEFQLERENGKRKPRKIPQCLCNYKENVCKNRVKFSFHCRCRCYSQPTTDFSRFSTIHSFVLFCSSISFKSQWLVFFHFALLFCGRYIVTSILTLIPVCKKSTTPNMIIDFMTLPGHMALCLVEFFSFKRLSI